MGEKGIVFWIRIKAFTMALKEEVVSYDLELSPRSEKTKF
jgi:hypothetical protein